MNRNGKSITPFAAIGFCLALRAFAGPFDPNAMIDIEKMKPKGTWEQVTWPDTLDLADRARIAVEGALTGDPDPAHHYIYSSGFQFQGNPHPEGLEWFHSMSYLQSIVYARTMSGSEANMDIEANMMRVQLESLHDDGMIYWPETADERINTTSFQKNGFSVFTMALTWYERDHNPAWLDMARLLTASLVRDYPPGPGVLAPHLPIYVQDRAYYPPECTFDPTGVLYPTGRGAMHGYTPPEEPDMDSDGVEGAARWYVTTGAIGAATALYRYTGDTSRMDLARRLVRFALKPGMWKNTGAEGYPGNEHGSHDGHFTCNVHNLLYLLDYAMAADDDWLKQFVREGYDYIRAGGVTRFGYFWPGWQETDFTAYLTAFAVRLSDAGLGDYWDDVDSIVRNRLTEQQFIDLNRMRAFSGNNSANDPLLRRYLGGFGVSQPTVLLTEVFGSNSQSGPYALYHAWHGITHFDRGVATVNLFLNRVSPWMDVASWLPYEGKVELTNKQARIADVRIPGWIDLSQIQCRLNDSVIDPPRRGHHLVFQNLAPGDVIRLEFPQPESTDRYYIPLDNLSYTIAWRGSTVLDIQPRDTDQTKWPILQRDSMKNAATTPMHTVTRFVSNEVLPLL